MTDAAATAEITDPLQTHAEADAIDNLSPVELLALANKMGGHVEEPAKASDAPAGETPAEAPAVSEDAPASPEATAVDPKEAERAERLAKVLAVAGEYKQKQSLRDQQAKHEAEVARFKAEAEATRAEAAALKAKLDAYKADPLAQLEADGFPADKLAQRALEAGTPEYKQAAEIKALKEQMLAEVRAEREAAAKAAEEANAQYRTQAYEHAKTRFVQQASNADAYPTVAKLAALHPEALVARAEKVIADAAARGYQASNEDVLEFFEKEYATTFGQPNQKSAAAASVTNPEKSAGPSAPGTIAAGKPRTLSNGMVEKSAVNSVSADEMPAEEFKKWMASQVSRT